MKLLIDAGADINAVGEMGETALHVAISQGDDHVVKILLDAGANPSVRSDFNETPREKAFKKDEKMKKLFNR